MQTSQQHKHPIIDLPCNKHIFYVLHILLNISFNIVLYRLVHKQYILYKYLLQRTYRISNQTESNLSYKHFAAKLHTDNNYQTAFARPQHLAANNGCCQLLSESHYTLYCFLQATLDSNCFLTAASAASAAFYKLLSTSCFLQAAFYKLLSAATSPSCC